MARFHHRAALSAMRAQRAHSHSRFCEVVESNIDPSLRGQRLWGETLALDAGEYACRGAMAPPIACGARGEYGGWDLEGGIIDPRLHSLSILGPAAAGENHFPQTISVGCLDGSAVENRPVGERQHYSSDLQDFVNLLEHPEQQCSDSNAGMCSGGYWVSVEYMCARLMIS